MSDQKYVPCVLVLTTIMPLNVTATERVKIIKGIRDALGAYAAPIGLEGGGGDFYANATWNKRKRTVTIRGKSL